MIPVADGTKSIVLPNAQVSITETAWGTLESITGTAELPLFPGELGALATMGGNVSIDPFDWATVWQAEVGEASVIVNNEDPNNPWIAFSGQLGYDDDYIRLPLGLEIPDNHNNTASVNAYIDADPSDAHPSFVEVEAHIRSFSNYASSNAMRLDGWFYGSEDKVEFEGQARLGHRRIEVSGYSDGQTTSFQGVFGERIRGKVNMGLYKARWSIDFTIAPSFTFGDTNEIQLTATARGCVKSKCDKVSADVELLDNGRVRLCADLPTVGRRCDKF